MKPPHVRPGRALVGLPTQGPDPSGEQADHYVSSRIPAGAYGLQQEVELAADSVLACLPSAIDCSGVDTRES